MPRTHPRPIVVLSRCLELDACRYNGQMIRAPVVAQVMPHVEIRPICPEVEIGLGVPRDPIRLIQIGGTLGLVQPSTGKDVTAAMEGFSNRYLATQLDADGFILKSRSPSCGIKDTKIYGGPDGTQPSDKGPGMFGGAVLERFPHAAVEDEGRLTNFRLRHHFLTKLFARATFRRVRAEHTMRALVEFHADYKLTLMAYHQGELKRLGRIVANPERKPIDTVLDEYEEHLAAALTRPPRYTSHLNVLQHALGYFKDGLTAAERRHFLDLLEEYRNERATLATALAVLQSWIVRFDERYLARQAYLEPYPSELLSLRDSGRGA
ncbi:MAG: DUF523 and DUF1722 domain-containing protein [Gemmatimonadales bacterium]|jgi:uncharacterized protein YbgA (DUF1722 family)/uncharacterized protein YbbK (DUF523 family)